MPADAEIALIERSRNWRLQDSATCWTRWATRTRCCASDLRPLDNERRLAGIAFCVRGENRVVTQSPMPPAQQLSPYELERADETGARRRHRRRWAERRRDDRRLRRDVAQGEGLPGSRHQRRRTRFARDRHGRPADVLPIRHTGQCVTALEHCGSWPARSPARHRGRLGRRATRRFLLGDADGSSSFPRRSPSLRSKRPKRSTRSRRPSRRASATAARASSCSSCIRALRTSAALSR